MLTMRNGGELDRILRRLERTVDSKFHPVRRLRTACTHLEDAGKLEALQPWVLGEMRRIEQAQNDINETVERLAGQLNKHLHGN